MALTLHKQEVKQEPGLYLQVPVDYVVLVDVVDALQNLVYAVAAKQKEQKCQG